MNTKQNSKVVDSPRGEVGEVDTRSPFHSVKDALNLFEEVNSSGEKSSTKKEKADFAERVMARETQLHLTLEELEMLKEKVMKAESSTKKALEHLKTRKNTIDDLNLKLNAVNMRKETAVKAVDSGISTLKILEKDFTPLNSWPLSEIETSRENYTVVITELHNSKLELQKLNTNLHTCVEENDVFLRDFKEAELTTISNTEKTRLLSLEFYSLSTLPEKPSNHVSDELLRKAADENDPAETIVNQLKTEIQKTKEEHIKLKEKEEETEQMAVRLNSILNKTEHDLNLSTEDLNKARCVRDEILATVRQVSAETASWKAGTEDVQRKTTELREEKESAERLLTEAEKKLKETTVRLEEAKAAEEKAVAEMRKTEGGRRADGGGDVVMSVREYEAMKRRTEGGWAEVGDIWAKKAEAEAAVKTANEKRTEKVVERMRDEVRGMREKMKVAVQRAETAEAAKTVVEGELRRWREREDGLSEEKEAERGVVVEVVEKGEKTASGKALFSSVSGIFHRHRKHGR